MERAGLWPASGANSTTKSRKLGLSRLIIFNKPFQVLSQFSDRDAQQPRKTLADFLVAPNYKAAGRLDYDSEGLLLLTDNGRLQHQFANPQAKQWKTYWVQVEGVIDNPAIKQLASGVTLKDGKTLPAQARIINCPPNLWPRVPPVRYRASVPDSWLELKIREGRNRQVRRMTAAVGFPTLRLIRAAIADFSLGDLLPGEHRSIDVDPPSTTGLPASRPEGETRRAMRLNSGASRAKRRR